MYDTHLIAAALGFPTKPPTAPITRSIRMLFKDRSSLEPYEEKKKFIPVKHRKYDSTGGLGDSQATLLKIVNRGKPITAATASRETRWTSNHCSMTLTALFKKGLVSRHKDKGNNTRWYVYTKRKETK